MWARMLRALRLESDFYEEMEHDVSATREARNVVLLVGVVSAAGAAILSLDHGPGAMLAAAVLRFALVVGGWLLWGAITVWLGTYLTAGTETRTNLGEVLRVLGYAHAPWLLGAFVFLPRIGPWLFLIGAVWALLAGLVGIHRALDFGYGRALITVLAGWIVILAAFLVLFLVFISLSLALGSVRG